MNDLVIETINILLQRKVFVNQHVILSNIGNDWYTLSMNDVPIFTHNDPNLVYVFLQGMLVVLE